MPLASHKAARTRPAAAAIARGKTVAVSPPRATRSSPSSSPAASPTSEAMIVATGNAAFVLERKAQELCQETRAQYELLLQRQEAAHERQLQAARATLQQVLSASISLADHQQLVASEKEARGRERDELAARHRLELHGLARAQAEKWARKLRWTQRRLAGEVDALKASCARLALDKSRVEATAAERERELASLRAQLHGAELKQREAHARVQEACRHLASLRASVRKGEARRRSAEDSAKAAACLSRRLRDKLASKAVDAAEKTGRLETHAAAVETQLSLALEALEAERAAAQTLQSEKKELAALALELERRVGQLEAREQLGEDARAAERLQFEREAQRLAEELEAERGTTAALRARVEDLQTAAVQAQLALQEERARLEAKEQRRESERERLARGVERLERREARLRARNESLRAEADELRRGMAEIEAFERAVATRTR